VPLQFLFITPAALITYIGVFTIRPLSAKKENKEPSNRNNNNDDDDDTVENKRPVRLRTITRSRRIPARTNTNEKPPPTFGAKILSVSRLSPIPKSIPAFYRIHGLRNDGIEVFAITLFSVVRAEQKTKRTRDNDRYYFTPSLKPAIPRAIGRKFVETNGKFPLPGNRTIYTIVSIVSGRNVYGLGVVVYPINSVQKKKKRIVDRPPIVLFT